MLNNDAIAQLQSEFAARRKRNPEFSVRAFARWLKISPAQLSQVLSGKRPLTLKMAAKISERLGLSPRERVDFLSAASQEITSAARGPGERKYVELDEDRFRVIADWPHFAILSLTRIPQARADSRWVARRLGISAAEANEAMGRLRRLGLLSAPPQFQQLGDPIRVLGRAPSPAIRKFHQQTLTLATERLELIPMEAREYQAITFALQPSKLEWFRKRLDDFLTEVCDAVETARATEVYTLAVQMFPLTLPGENLEKKEGSQS